MKRKRIPFISMTKPEKRRYLSAKKYRNVRFLTDSNGITWMQFGNRQRTKL